jgi:hypothetical protein
MFYDDVREPSTTAIVIALDTQEGIVVKMPKLYPFSAAPVPAELSSVQTGVTASPRRTTRQIASLLVAVGVGVTLAACGHSGQSKPTGSSSAQPQPPSSSTAAAAPPAAYDISRVDNVKNDFPPGFTPDPHPAKTLDQHDIDSSHIGAFIKAQVDPPQCRSLIIPPYAEPSVGTEAAGVRGDGDQGEIYVVAFRLPKAVPAGQPPAGCDRVSLSGSPEVAGTAQRIPAPEIDGFTTSGARVSPTAAEDDEPDYIFTAALNDQTSVVVMGSTDAQLNPQQLLSDLLVKGTSAVRGQ